MDNNNRNSRTGRQRRSRRLQNLPALPNVRPPLLRPPLLRPPLLRPPLLQSRRVLPENWSPSSENWSPSSEYWRQSPTQYWPPPSESWPPVMENWRYAVGNRSPLTEDRQSHLLSNNGQALFSVLNRRNRRAESTVPNNLSASVTEQVQTEEASDSDVVYLYSVDTSAEGHFAEEVDLTADSTISSTRTEPVSEEPQPVKCSKARKRKASDSRVKTEKRHRRNHGQPCCSFCQAHYDELLERNQILCVARCGHTFCRPCTSAKGASKVCNICKTLIGSLYKIFL